MTQVELSRPVNTLLAGKLIGECGPSCPSTRPTIQDMTVTDESGKVALMPMMPTMGMIQGNLDDVMYGVLDH